MNKGLSRDLFWNTAGSLLYALSSMVLAFFVMRTAGAEDGGIFGFGFSTFGQQMFIVAYFGIRPFQITDVKNEYSFGEYVRARIISSLIAVLGAFLFLGFMALSGRYSPYKGAVIMLLALCKITDGFADVFESECQRQGKLYLGGKALFMRTLLMMAGLMAGLLISGSLLIGALTALFSEIAGLLFFNVRLFKEGFPKEDMSLEPGKIKGIFRDTALLFLSVFLDFYIFSSVKYAIDLCLTDEVSGIFNILFMPTSFVYLVANFIIKPFMTMLASAFELGEKKRFMGICRKIELATAGLILAAFGAALLLGGPVLRLGELILGAGYSGSLYNNRYSFAVIILGGGFYALANFYYYILVIMRRQKSIFAVYLCTAAAALFASYFAVSGYGMTGAAICYCLLMLTLLLSFAGISAYELSRGDQFSHKEGR